MRRITLLLLAVMALPVIAHAEFWKNKADQAVPAQMKLLSTGEDFTGTVVVYVACDNEDTAAAEGTVTNDGAGLYIYHPTQAETNCNYVGYKFAGSGAITKTQHFYPAISVWDEPYWLHNSGFGYLVNNIALNSDDTNDTVAAIATTIGTPANGTVSADIADLSALVWGIAADPWLYEIPGAYPVGSVGYVLGNALSGGFTIGHLNGTAATEFGDALELRFGSGPYGH